MTTFKSLPDGEHALCQSCHAKGYGIDSYHPCTPEFWRTRAGQIAYAKCLGCESEICKGSRGFVSLEAAA